MRTFLLLLLPVVANAATHATVLPTCECENFRNGLTTDHEGMDACMKLENHGIEGGTETWCSIPSRTIIPFVDNGCPSDQYRCTVQYLQPLVPACNCDVYYNGASPSSTDGLCQKKTEHTCYPRNSAGDKKIGNAEFYGCPEDMCVPIDSPPPHPTCLTRHGHPPPHAIHNTVSVWPPPCHVTHSSIVCESYGVLSASPTYYASVAPPLLPSLHPLPPPPLHDSPRLALHYLLVCSCSLPPPPGV